MPHCCVDAVAYTAPQQRKPLRKFEVIVSKNAVMTNTVCTPGLRAVGVMSAMLLVMSQLSACGGGGGGGGDDSDQDQAAQAGTETRQDVVLPNNSGSSQAGSATTPTLQPTQTVVNTTTCESKAAPPAPPANAILVTNYGAVPNDESDDTNAIQAAINAARAGDWVVFPAGRYIHHKSLTVLRPRVTLYGEGAVLHASNPSDQSIMLKADGGRVYNFTLTAVTEGRRGEPWTSRISVFGLDSPNGYLNDIIVQNNRIVPADLSTGTPLSNGASAAGILVVGARNFTIAGNTVRRSLSDGIHITHSSRNGRIVNNTVTETGDDMIAVVSYLNTQWRTNARSSSTWLTEHQNRTLAQDILIANNTVSDQYWGRGISVVGGKNVTIKNNDISRSAMAAGILLSREEVPSTHGVNNVLVLNNTIRDIQTHAPSYMPSGPFFTTLASLTAVNGGKTGQGGIEIHNISRASDYQDPQLKAAVHMSKIAIRGNAIDNVGRDGVRIGAASPTGSIDVTRLIGNVISRARVLPIDARMSDATAAPVQCQDNSYSGVPFSMASCETVSNTDEVTGASLDCSTLAP